MRHGAEWARERFSAARVARLATVSGDGSPHLVPITFAVVGDGLISAIDAKPKSSATALRRLDNIATNPFVSVLADHYDDDWTMLWWARADGWARIVPHDRAEGLDPLVAKYQQYRSARPNGLVILISVDRWSGWSAS
jgi:PPOX class probable F420-dependent enzyme